MVPSLIARTLSSRGSLRRPKHPGHLRHSRRKPRHKRHQPIPGIPGLLAPPLRLTVLAGFVGRQLLRGSTREADAPAHCIPVAGQAPDHPVSWCSRSPRSSFPGSALSCAALHASSPFRTCLRLSRVSVHSKVARASSLTVVAPGLAAAMPLPRPGLEADAVGLKTRASENLEKQKRDRQPLKSASTMRSQGPRPHWVLSSPTVPLFAPGRRPHFWFLRPPSPTCRERGDRKAHSGTMGSVAPQESMSVIRIHDRILPEPGPKSVTRPCARGTGTRPTVSFLPACQRTPRLPGRSCQ